MDSCTNCARKAFCGDFSGDLGVCKSHTSDSQIQPNEALREARDRVLSDFDRAIGGKASVSGLTEITSAGTINRTHVTIDPELLARANGELPAAPCVHRNESFSGLTKREAFAMAAMTGYRAHPHYADANRNEVASLACDDADALLLALEHKEGAA